MLLSYILALLSREASLILPVLFLVYHYVFKEKIKTKEFFSILGLTFLYALLRFTLLGGLLAGDPPAATTVLERLPGFFVAVTNYLKLLILPFNLHMEYGYRQFNLAEPKVIIGIGIFVISLIYAFRQRKANKLISFSILWFFIGLLPVSDIYPVNAYMAEHWLYLPSLGFFLFLAWAIDSLYKKKGFRIISIILTISLLAFYSYLAIKQNNYWREPITFYKRTLAFTPNSPRMLNNLGDAYDKIGKKEEAVMLYREAIKFDPRCAEAYNNIGNINVSIGKYLDAVVAYKQALAINSNYVEIYNNLAGAYLLVGKPEDAITALKKAIEINPGYAMSYSNLAKIYFNLRQYDLAVRYYDEAVKLGFTDAAFSRVIEPLRQGK
jgi:tetratricopeptide (TPR) repeat protein